MSNWIRKKHKGISGMDWLKNTTLQPSNFYRNPLAGRYSFWECELLNLFKNPLSPQKSKFHRFASVYYWLDSLLLQRKSALFSSESALFWRKSAAIPGSQLWFRRTWGLFQRCSLPENLWTALIQLWTALISSSEIWGFQTWSSSESELISPECLRDVNPG